LHEDADFVRYSSESSISHLAKIGVVNKKSDIYRQKCQECTFFPFSIALHQRGRIDFIATSYELFKQWIYGINVLIRMK
jgi:hypothetical protein